MTNLNSNSNLRFILAEVESSHNSTVDEGDSRIGRQARRDSSKAASSIQ